MMPSASEFFERLLIGRNVLTERAEIEATVRYRYRGHSQGALVSALHKAFEAVDQSPLVLGEAAGAVAERAAGRHRHRARLTAARPRAAARPRVAARGLRKKYPPKRVRHRSLGLPTLVPGGARARNASPPGRGGGR